MPASRPSLAFRLLLRLYPRAYRERYGREMEAFFRRERTEAGGGPRFWARLVLDHAEAAWAVRAGGREGRMGRWTPVFEDLRAAARSLRRAPGFAVFAAATLALGVGATAGVFTVVDRVVLRPLPYPGSERMVLTGIDPKFFAETRGPLSPVLFRALQDAPGPAEAVVAARRFDVVLREGPDPERVRTTGVSEGFFPFFGATPAVGRLLRPEDHEAGAEPVLVLGHDVWTSRWGGDPGVVGRAVRVDDELRTVVGVVGAGFHTPPELVEAPDYWTPLEMDWEARGSFTLTGVARLRPGATLEELDAHADQVVDRIYELGGEEAPAFLAGAAVEPYRDTVVGPLAGTLGRVLAAVFLLLAIACVNVAGLLLTRGAERRHELAVHTALGAPRVRLVRRLLAESALLAAAGGAAGAALAWASVELFRRYAPSTLPRLAEVAVDGRGLAFALGVAGLTVLFFGALPALRSTGGLAASWSGPRGSTAGRSEGRLRGGLVALETALAVVLAVGSGLLAHDLARVASEDPGFRAEGMAVLTLDLAPRFGPEEWAPTWERLLEQVEAVPGAGAVAVATQAPYDGSRTVSSYRPEGWEGGEGEDRIMAVTVAVAGEYLDALDGRIVEGRALGAADGSGPPVAVVNDAFAREYWPGESAVGKTLAEGEEDEAAYRVVGVMEDVNVRPGREASPHVFLPLAVSPWRQMEILVRAEGGDAAALASGLRDAVRQVDPGLPVSRIQTLEAMASEGLSASRFYAVLFGAFAAAALLLAVVGVYGTTSFATRRRLREAGIRLALGARSGQVVRRLVSGAAASVGLGVLLGLGAAAAGAGFLAERLHHLDPRDAPTYLAVGATVVLAGLVAAWIPAAAAGRTDPAATLREE